MAGLLQSPVALSVDEKIKRIDQAIDALKFAHDSVSETRDGATVSARQEAIMSVIVDLGLDAAALNAEAGRVAHG